MEPNASNSVSSNIAALFSLCAANINVYILVCGFDNQRQWRRGRRTGVQILVYRKIFFLSENFRPKKTQFGAKIPYLERNLGTTLKFSLSENCNFLPLLFLTHDAVDHGRNFRAKVGYQIFSPGLC